MPNACSGCIPWLFSSWLNILESKVYTWTNLLSSMTHCGHISSYNNCSSWLAWNSSSSTTVPKKFKNSSSVMAPEPSSSNTLHVSVRSSRFCFGSIWHSLSTSFLMLTSWFSPTIPLKTETMSLPYFCFISSNTFFRCFMLLRVFTGIS